MLPSKSLSMEVKHALLFGKTILFTSGPLALIYTQWTVSTSTVHCVTIKASWFCSAITVGFNNMYIDAHASLSLLALETRAIVCGLLDCLVASRCLCWLFQALKGPTKCRSSEGAKHVLDCDLNQWTEIHTHVLDQLVLHMCKHNLNTTHRAVKRIQDHIHQHKVGPCRDACQASSKRYVA